jgi:hypothetical protein
MYISRNVCRPSRYTTCVSAIAWGCPNRGVVCATKTWPESARYLERGLSTPPALSVEPKRWRVSSRWRRPHWPRPRRRLVLANRLNRAIRCGRSVSMNLRSSANALDSIRLSVYVCRPNALCVFSAANVFVNHSLEDRPGGNARHERQPTTPSNARVDSKIPRGSVTHTLSQSSNTNFLPRAMPAATASHAKFGRKKVKCTKRQC